RRLDKLTEPEVIVHRVKVPPNAKAGGADRALAAPGGVQVLDQQRVGGFLATVLAADDPKALTDWLNKHAYATRPELTEWLAPYVKKSWIITAFKIDKGGRNQQELATSAVRMTFTTDRPFYPYSEPADQRQARRDRRDQWAQAPRLLRVHFLSDKRMAGKLGDG